MTEEEYKAAFGIDPLDRRKAKEALGHALDIRKFEIELYWKRATYFWALIAVAFAGYFAILGSEHLIDKQYLAYIVSCVGILFTWAWFLVNRGSKYWQENWENHVDMLEDVVTGPLYKTVLYRPQEENLTEKYFTGPLPVSASKSNQWVSLFTVCIWVILIIHALPELHFDCTYVVDYYILGRHIVPLAVTLLFGKVMFKWGRTFPGSYDHVAQKRDTKIIPPPP
ncbi:hypothetical protein LPW11_06120 [Geomonas sp. RF6]|uniref:RipA family octameric membrane protein n=1 Tax=Geomonas sp. RF6 TaxID=2897342 RepID=UPI001E648971|nr:hypothetical protein [Geomonas sp. RF6]UFS71766.1 hypothetical protein LPW11_06120 [Geomonas sp. RF6]